MHNVVTADGCNALHDLTETCNQKLSMATRIPDKPLQRGILGSPVNHKDSPKWNR